MQKIKSIRTLAVSAVLSTVLTAAAADEAVKYVPNIHGTIRPRFEMSTDGGEERFQVRNARLSFDGRIATWADYYINLDLCDRGKMKILDVWARASLGGGVSAQAGQFRMPFGVDPFRAPHQYYFANRSTIGKEMCNYRAVGAKLSWAVRNTPLKLEAGAFNPTAIGDHDVWNKSLAYAASATLTPGNTKFSTGFMSIRPYGVRANMFDFTAGWGAGRWIVEAEYMYKHYTNSEFDNAHAYSVFADYHMPVKLGVFNKLSFQGRFDGITDHSDANPGEEGYLTVTDHARNRVTVGSTISYIRSKSMYLDLRLNYEKYFYHHGYEPSAAGGDKIVAELVLRF